MNTPKLPQIPADVSIRSRSAGASSIVESFLPNVTTPESTPQAFKLTRADLIRQKQGFVAQRGTASAEAKGLSRASPERTALYQEIQDCRTKADLLEVQLQSRFVPQHSPSQFISPRAFFVTPLFNAKNKSVPRSRDVKFPLVPGPEDAIWYSGPELRQSDGRVFLALLNMLRDIQIGTAVTFQPDELCRALFGRYDGNSRAQLRAHIQRLQKGLVLTNTFSVQLCLKFEYPKRGGWEVGLDRHIVELFRASPAVWFPLRSRLGLPEGLSTWLYTFIESQTKLIPMKISTIRSLSGSDAETRSFTNSLRLALRQVAEIGAIDTGWSVRNREVRWLKL